MKKAFGGIIQDLKKPTFYRNLAEEGMELVEDMAEPRDINISDLEIISFLKAGEGYVSGETVRRRSVKLHTNLGQYHAEHLLAYQNEIPKEWQGYHLVFPGTVWRHPSGGHLFMPFLYWNDKQQCWRLGFDWFMYVGFPHDRLLRPQKI